MEHKILGNFDFLKFRFLLKLRTKIYNSMSSDIIANRVYVVEEYRQTSIKFFSFDFSSRWSYPSLTSFSPDNYFVDDSNT